MAEKTDEECKTPGEKERSSGQGRGAATGKGKGPMGVPVGEKLKVLQQAVQANRPPTEEEKEAAYQLGSFLACLD